MIKWAKILMTLPVWGVYLLLFAFRTSNLITFGVISIVVFVLSFFVDIWVRVRNWLIDVVVAPVLEWMSPINTLLYYIFIWPWELAFYVIGLVLLVFYYVFAFIFTILYYIWAFTDPIFWWCFWLIHDYVTYPVFSFLWEVIIYIPNIIITWWGELMKALF